MARTTAVAEAGPLDIIINNAAQTVRRSGNAYKPLVDVSQILPFLSFSLINPIPERTKYVTWHVVLGVLDVADSAELDTTLVSVCFLFVTSPRTRRGLKGQIPVFSKADIMFLAVYAFARAGKYILLLSKY